ncbi:MAG: hypothetical protein JRN39_04135 [Nitrososphaerota archaeon]|nr:hypothetical protein [Nitrososphaerota archaeon]MDG6939574.1 hypothetical protein [Nitrososphaerota archaeon]
MFLLHHPFGGVVPPDLGLIAALLYLVLAVCLLFLGRSIIKALAFVMAGVAGMVLGGLGGAALLGGVGLVLGAALGFLAFGMIGYFLVPVGIGLAIGYAAYEIAGYLTPYYLVAVLVGVVFFVAGAVLADRLIEAATAFLGALIVYDVAVYFGSPSLVAVAAAVLLGAAGFAVQNEQKKAQRPAA